MEGVKLWRMCMNVSLGQLNWSTPKKSLFRTKAHVWPFSWVFSRGDGHHWQWSSYIEPTQYLSTPYGQQFTKPLNMLIEPATSSKWVCLKLGCPRIHCWKSLCSLSKSSTWGAMPHFQTIIWYLWGTLNGSRESISDEQRCYMTGSTRAMAISQLLQQEPITI